MKIIIHYVFFVVLCLASLFLWILSFTNGITVRTLPYYGLFMSFYFLIQIITSTCNRWTTPKPDDDLGPTVSILVVGYREDQDLWKNCLESIVKQTYLSLHEIVVSIDGDEEGDEPMRHTAYEVLHQSSIASRIFMNPHGGKRSAMYYGFKHILESGTVPKYILVTDSDTVFDPHATSALVACIDKSSHTGCATGSLTVFSTHFLGRIVNARYAYAFNIERASMSFFGVMNCCSGPLSIYRADLLTDELLDMFLNQECCGEKCGPGDDRHLTCLVMIQGFKSRHTHYARAATEAPPTIMRFIIQQSRWMRSFYREIPWQVRAIGFQHPALALITQFEVIYPFLVIGWVIYASINHTHILRGTLVALAIILIRTTILFFYMGCDPRMFLNIMYLPLYFLCLLPVKVSSLLTVKEMGWTSLTRDGTVRSRTPVMPFLAITLWLSFLTVGLTFWGIQQVSTGLIKADLY